MAGRVGKFHSRAFVKFPVSRQAARYFDGNLAHSEFHSWSSHRILALSDIDRRIVGQLPHTHSPFVDLNTRTLSSLLFGNRDAQACAEHS